MPSNLDRTQRFVRIKVLPTLYYMFTLLLPMSIPEIEF